MKKFGVVTRELHQLADYLKQHGIKTVAMESTGYHWKPLFLLLQKRGFEVYLVNARHIKNVKGRKTDVIDCQFRSVGTITSFTRFIRCQLSVR